MCIRDRAWVLRPPRRFTSGVASPKQGSLRMSPPSSPTRTPRPPRAWLHASGLAGSPIHVERRYSCLQELVTDKLLSLVK
eukprot:4039959-Alexandrium_andersonii.AAC.1